jgi:hypothetical protein
MDSVARLSLVWKKDNDGRSGKAIVAAVVLATRRQQEKLTS